MSLGVWLGVGRLGVVETWILLSWYVLALLTLLMIRIVIWHRDVGQLTRTCDYS